MARGLDDLRWQPRLTRLSPPFWERVAPEPLEDPYLVSFNDDAAALIDLDPAAGREAVFVEVVAGRRALHGADPIAHRYSGHQFGVYVPQLGDGRALLLGEAIGANGARCDVQVKGSGRTPFSRAGDGRAVLRSTIREYLGSEAMHGLGIPTTRGLAIVGSDEPVYRERAEPAAVLVRLAPSHLRFGSFEMFAHLGKPELVQELADFVIAEHFSPAIAAGAYDALFREMVARTARLVAGWQAVGFTHGVLNTDNMSILGLTLDYGPFAFMEGFDLAHVPNHSDDQGRYAFGRQPAIALWNLGCLAHALLPLLGGEDAARAALETYGPIFAEAHEEQFRKKLGLTAWRGEDDLTLLRALLRVLAREHADYPRFFRLLGDFPAVEPLRALFADRRPFDAWCEHYRERLARDGRDPAERKRDMDRVNPKYVLRTHLAQAAIERAEMKDFREIDRLLAIVRDPFSDRPGDDAYAHPAPADAPHVALSCSS